MAGVGGWLDRRTGGWSGGVGDVWVLLGREDGVGVRENRIGGMGWRAEMSL